MKTLTKKEEHILLAIHHLKENAYLVNIRKQLKEMTGKELDVGTINKPLKRLNGEGYLKSHFGKPTPVRGGKAIKYYTLTEKALKALAEEKSIHDRMWKNVVFINKIII